MIVLIIAALTADGFIGRDAHNFSMDWTSREDEKLFVRLTKEAGVVVFGSRTAQTIIAAGRHLPGRRKIVYTHNPASFEAAGFEPTDEVPTELIKRLEADGARGLAICGGASIYDLFLRAGVVDELYLTIEPKLFGAGVPLFNGSLERDLTLLKTEALNADTILLHYKLKQ